MVTLWSPCDQDERHKAKHLIHFTAVSKSRHVYITAFTSMILVGRN